MMPLTAQMLLVFFIVVVIMVAWILIARFWNNTRALIIISFACSAMSVCCSLALIWAQK